MEGIDGLPPVFRHDALGWLDVLAKQFSDSILEVALKNAERTNSDITLEVMQEAALIVMQSRPDYLPSEPTED